MWGSSRTMFCQNIVKIGLLTLLRKQRHWRPAANGMGSSRAAGGGLGRTEAAAACLPLYSAGASSPHLFDFFPLCLAFHVFPQSNWTSACIVTLVAFFSWKIGQCACLSLCPAGGGSSRTHTKGFTQKILQLVSAILGRSKESTCQNEEFHSSSYRSPWTQLGQLVLSPSGWNKVQNIMGGRSHPFQDERKELVRWEGTQEDVPCPKLEGQPGGFPFFSFLSMRILLVHLTQTSGTGGLKTETLPANLRQRAVVNQRVDPFTDFPSLRCSGCSLPDMHNPVFF